MHLYHISSISWVIVPESSESSESLNLPVALSIWCEKNDPRLIYNSIAKKFGIEVLNATIEELLE